MGTSIVFYLLQRAILFICVNLYCKIQLTPWIFTSLFAINDVILDSDVTLWRSFYLHLALIIDLDMVVVMHSIQTKLMLNILVLHNSLIKVIIILFVMLLHYNYDVRLYKPSLTSVMSLIWLLDNVITSRF